MKISVVTVCYNMAAYIEQTIRSVLDQKYDGLEYIIIDGGSTDGTVDIIRKYSDQLAYFVSEPDKGMYDALRKGLGHATGEVVAWLNADDVYFPWTFDMVGRVFSAYPDVSWVGGRHAYLSPDGMLSQVCSKCSAKSKRDISNGWCRSDVIGPLQQESMFWRRSLYEASGGIDPSYRYAGDFDLWRRFADHAELVKIDVPLAAFRRRKDSLSSSGSVSYDDEISKSAAHCPSFPNLFWRVCGHNRALNQALRVLRFRRIELVYFPNDGSEPRKKRILTNCSNHTFGALKTYGK